MITLYVNMDAMGVLVDATGNKPSTPLAFQVQSYQTYIVNFCVLTSGVPVNQNVADAVTWAAWIDDDFDSTSACFVTVPNEDIDSTDSADGIIRFAVDCDTPAFIAAVAGKASISGYFQVAGFNSGGKKIYSYIFSCTLYNSLYITT
jgi:hypothetical protein